MPIVFFRNGSLLACLVSVLALAGCEDGEAPGVIGGAGAAPVATTPATAAPTATTPPAATTAAPVAETPMPTTFNFGTPQQGGSGSSSDRWQKSAVTRNGANYYFMANGWGPGFTSQSVSWSGTSFTVESMAGKQGAGYEPASYPTMFCGTYSDSKSGECGLPKAIADIKTLQTGWKWNPGGNAGQYNAAYDIWLASGPAISNHNGFLMVWYRDPPGQQPAGTKKASGIAVANVPGLWDFWAGTVGGKPCLNYVRAEGKDITALEFDVMDFVRDLPNRKVTVPGTHILSVAVGFEIWNGPITNLKSEDFYVDVK